MKQFKTHLFICTNQAHNPEKCGGKNSETLRKNLKELCSQQEWGKEVRINAAGCLGNCELGIAAIQYPEKKWFVNLKEGPEAVDDLFNAVKSTMETNK